MSKLTSNELSESLTNLIDEKQNVEEYSLMTENKTIVGAINEIYGKEIIANAIGEPLDRSDTFTEMSDDINNLLSTFKTNMMNNGVTVESGDKFKQLIDKIATMTEEGSGKGIQIIEGVANFNKTNYEISFTIDFEPYLVLICHDFTSGSKYKKYYLYYPSVYPNALSWYLQDGVLTESNITETHAIVKNGSVYTLQNAQFEGTETGLTFTAIGVGEEDTTLRDSLADILENKGVDITEEDDMASLIGKVDDINTLQSATSNTGRYYTLWSNTSSVVCKQSTFMDLATFTPSNYVAGASTIYFSGALKPTDSRYAVVIRIWDNTTSTEVASTSTTIASGDFRSCSFTSVDGHEYKLQMHASNGNYAGQILCGFLGIMVE